MSDSDRRGTALIAGATGIVGRALSEHLESLAGWDAIGISRRAANTRTRHLSADLLDADSVERIGAELADVTHVFYAAYLKKERSADEVEPNLSMLKNLVETVERCARDLRHVQLVHGSKWYGSHRGPYRTPAREDHPRHPLPVFYYAQQDWLSERRRGARWSWSALRPHGIWGFAVGSQLHMMNAVAVYATLMKHHGLPLHFPGKRGAYEALYQCTEASHLAEAMVWAATTPAAANEAFNMTNGDFIRWRDAWPAVAAWFEMEPGRVMGFDLAEFAAENEEVWARLCSEHGLLYPDMYALTTWDSAVNYVFNADWDQVSSMTKARRSGWSGAVDTYEMFARQFERLVAERVIPDPRAGTAR